MPAVTKAPTARQAITSPDCVALSPSTFCRYSGIANSRPNSPRLTSSAVMLPNPKERSRNRSRSTNRARPARWRLRAFSRKTATQMIESAKAKGITEIEELGQSQPNGENVSTGAHQPYVRPSISAKTSAASPVPMLIAPTASPVGRALASRDSRTYLSDSTIRTAAMGMLIRKIQRHPKLVVIQPPRIGPRAAMPPIVPPHTPNAAARSLPWKVELTIDNVEGSTSAPPTPCSRRARISSSPLPAMPARTLEPAKIARPAM